MSKNKPMEKCKTCIHYNEKDSNENWVVCPKIPLEVMTSGTSKNCSEFKPKER